MEIVLKVRVRSPRQRTKEYTAKERGKSKDFQRVPMKIYQSTVVSAAGKETVKAGERAI